MKTYVLYGNGLTADKIIANNDKDAVWTLCPKWDLSDKDFSLYCRDAQKEIERKINRNYILKLIKD